MGNKITRTRSPPAYSETLTEGDTSAIEERVFAIEARLKEQKVELDDTRTELRRLREEHEKLVATTAKLDSNVEVALGSDLPQRLSEYDELIYKRGIVTRDNITGYTPPNPGYGTDLSMITCPKINDDNSVSAVREQYAIATILWLLHNDVVKSITFGGNLTVPGLDQ
ncbi:hypothetical protein HKX48_001361 [Thoreauomyces humboldtii]|nr:hypothetical protein HKX48_001361 [Thoreauomyces humboldtii]